MVAFLKLPQLPFDIVQLVMMDGRSLWPGGDNYWQEFVLYLTGHRVARWEDQGLKGLGELLFEGLQKSSWSTKQARQKLFENLNDSRKLGEYADEALRILLIESSKAKFWNNLLISSEVADGIAWFEVRHAVGPGYQRLTLGANEDEPSGSLSMKLEVHEDREVSIQMFGPMLASLCFGRATAGTRFNVRPARLDVRMKLFDAEEEALTAARALVRIADLAESTVPRTIFM